MSRGWEELESGRISDLLRSKAYFERLVEFHWEYYSELEFQRNQIREQLKSSLRDTAQPFEFTKWQRIVRYKYSLTPLSTKGSLVDPGGRFNIGDIDCARYPVFPALYIASDKGTALAEVLGREKGTGSLTPEELALTKPDSITAVSVSGRLESIVDIRDRSNLGGVRLSRQRFQVVKISNSKSAKIGLSFAFDKNNKGIRRCLGATELAELADGFRCAVYLSGFW